MTSRRVLLAVGDRDADRDLGDALLAAVPSDGSCLLHRCADLEDLLVTAATGVAEAAVVSAYLPRLDREALARLAALGVAAVGLAADAQGAQRLRMLGVDDVLPHPTDASALEAAVVRALARSAETRVPLLIDGETGSGKTHLVREFHRQHLGAGAPLVVVDGLSLGESGDADAELRRALGRAAGGLLFITEIDAVDRATLKELLRPAGGPDAPRIVAATRTPVSELARTRHFLTEAFEAVDGRLLSLPPLRLRSDFDELVRAFVRDACPDRPVYVCPEALALLRRHRWPGNLRELRNQLRLILALMGDDANQLCHEDVPSELFDDDGAAG
jgi:transcriptional regulator of acetoin/glycerol metabolism